jgi:hypothetical protein
MQNRVAVAASQARIKGNLPAHLESVIDNRYNPSLLGRLLLRDRITSCAKNDFVIKSCNKKHFYRVLSPGIALRRNQHSCWSDTSCKYQRRRHPYVFERDKSICDSYDEYTIHLFFADADISGKV